MARFICLLAALLWSSLAGAQVPEVTPPAEAPPTTVSPPAKPCAETDALCILSEQLRRSDSPIGSQSGNSSGYIARQPLPGSVFPGGRFDPALIPREFKS